MSLHLFANFVTPFGTAANNRAETEGNITTLQKLLWMGETHSTVSAEAIRFALRRLLAGEEETNRSSGTKMIVSMSGRILNLLDGLVKMKRLTSMMTCSGI